MSFVVLNDHVAVESVRVGGVCLCVCGVCVCVCVWCVYSSVNKEAPDHYKITCTHMNVHKITNYRDVSQTSISFCSKRKTHQKNTSQSHE